jgi:outer membrane protein assembly factor BamA
LREVEIVCEQEERGLIFRVILSPIRVVKRIRIEGNRFLYDSDIIDALPIALGDPLDPDSPQLNQQVEAIKDAVTSLYEKEGFRDTDVETVVDILDDLSTELRVIILEGQRLRVRNIEVHLQADGEKGLEDAQNMLSCPKVAESDLRRFTEGDIGSPFTLDLEQNAKKALTTKLRRLGFEGIRIESRSDYENGLMSLVVHYRACNLIHFFIRDKEEPGREGFRPYLDDALLSALPFGDSGVFDLGEARIGRAMIKEYFQSKGYLLVDVVLDYRARDTFGTGVSPRVSSVISFYITLNGRKQIRGIRLLGKTSISRKDILGAMTTKPYDFFGDPGIVMVDRIFSDLQNIRELYGRKGFKGIDFFWARKKKERMLEVSKDGKATLYTWSEGDLAFRIRVLPNTEAVYIEIGIIEGKQTVLGDVLVEGIRFFDKKALIKEFGLVSGLPFSLDAIEEAASEIKARYQSEGFFRARVDLLCRANQGKKEWAECKEQPLNDAVIDLLVSVTEEDRARIGGVFVQGLSKTRDYVVLRELPKVGEAFSMEEIASGIRQLKNTGIFEWIRLKTVVDTKEAKEVTLIVQCREARTRFVEFSVGLESLNRTGEFPKVIASSLSHEISTNDSASYGYARTVYLNIPDMLITGEVRYSDTNFMGYGKQFYLPLKYGLSATAWDRFASFTPTYVDPRFLTRMLSLRITPFVTLDRATRMIDLFETGVETELSKEVVSHLFASLSSEVAEVTTRDPEVETSYSRFNLQTKVVPSIVYDRLDSPLNPKKGGLAQTALSYINTYERDEVSNFLKLEMIGKAFWTLKNFFTFGWVVRFGMSEPLGGADTLPKNERFTLGGNRGMRGFANDGISQYNSDGSLRLDRNPDGTFVKRYGGDLVVASSVELRFPIVRRLHLYGAGFYDMGGLADRFSEFSWKSFRHSAGVGVRFILGGTIPIRLDYGVILDRRCSDIDPKTGRCTAKEEIGNIHFGFLYTF